MTIEFSEIARLPASGDNAAVAARRIEAGQSIAHNNRGYTTSHTVMEGHRFASEPINEGAALLSWGLPFGRALRDIKAGDYICNARMLEVLSERHADFRSPPGANFVDHAAHLAEVVLLGNIAIRTKEKLLWDGPNLRFTNSEEANKLINPPYREAWSL